MRKTRELTALFGLFVALAAMLVASPAQAHEDGYLYYGQHPIPYSVADQYDTDWVDWEDYHYFEYAPDDEEMDFYIMEEGAYIYVGDPTMYGDAEGDEYWYHNPHPVDYYGYHHNCYIYGPHVHYFAPTAYWLSSYHWDGHSYVWYGPWHSSYTPHRKIYLSHRYPHAWKHSKGHASKHNHYKKRICPCDCRRMLVGKNV